MRGQAFAAARAGRFIGLLGVLTVAAAAPASAQQPRILLPPIHHASTLGALALNLSPVDGQIAVFGGLRGALILNRAFGVGGGAYGLINDVRTPVTDTTDARVIAYYGGLELEYTVLPLWLLHPTVSVLVGAGAARYSRDEAVTRRWSEFFVVEPAAHLVVNITEQFQIAGGAGYRHTAGLSLPDFGDDRLRGVTGILTLRFGRI